MLRPRRPLFRIPAKTGYFSLLRNVHTGFEAHRTSCSMGNGVHPRGYSGRDVKLTTYFHLVLRLRLNGVMALLLLCVFTCCCNLRGQIDLQPFPFSCWMKCIICADKPTRCNTSYEWYLLFIIWFNMFRTITSPSSGASSHKLYNALQASLAVALLRTSTQQRNS